jgi:hypothetical protein
MLDMERNVVIDLLNTGTAEVTALMRGRLEKSCLVGVVCSARKKEFMGLRENIQAPLPRHDPKPKFKA